MTSTADALRQVRDGARGGPARPPTAAASGASGSSFYAGMRVLPKAERQAMYAVYGFCRIVDDIADDLHGDRVSRRAELDAWRADLERLYAGAAPGRAAFLAEPVRRFALAGTDFAAVVDGMQMDVDADIRAPDMTTLDLYIDRVACAVGRLSVRVFGMDQDPGLALARHLGRALQLTNILRDLDEDAAIGRLYVPRETLERAAIVGDDPVAVVNHPNIDAAARSLLASARAEYAAADRVLAARPGGRLLAPRLMSAVYAKTLERTAAAGWRPPRSPGEARQGRAAVAGGADGDRVIGASPSPGSGDRAMTVHVVGAGLAGLRSVVTLARRGVAVEVSDAAAQAGGRCRSYFDPQLGLTIDNGNHLVLSGNTAVHAYLDDIGAGDRLSGPDAAVFHWADLRTGERWTLRPQRRPAALVGAVARPPRAGYARRRLPVAAPPHPAAARSPGRRGDDDLRRALGPADRPLPARRPEHRRAGGLGRAGRSGGARDPGQGRRGLLPAHRGPDPLDRLRGTRA